MEKKKLRIGVFGGQMGCAHAGTIRAMKDDAEIVAFCEKDTDHHEKCKTHLAPGGKIFTDFDEFINFDLDAVVLANYFDEHAKYAIKCFEKGVAVLSETTAAPSLAECVELVEAYEKYGAKYALALNCPYFKSVYKMKQILESGKVGKVLHGEAEYLHSAEKSIDSSLELKKIEGVDLDNLHWRQTLPTCYYNMHSLGPLMYITNSLPKTVYCNAIRDDEFYANSNKALKDSPGAIVMTKMDNNAVFTTTGCASYPPTSKWYRLNCENGCLETERYDWREERLVYATKADYYESTLPDGMASGLENDETKKISSQADTSHHGGINFFTSYRFVKYLLGEQESEFDVYKAATLSATGILAWYSALTSKEFRLPDFKNPADRELIRYDNRKPFAKSYKDITVPCKLADKDKFDLYDPKYKFGL